MVIGERLKQLREARKMSQGDIEKATGLLRCYTSRVENGHTVPSIETLEKYASALKVPLWQLFAAEGTKAPKALKGAASVTVDSRKADKHVAPFMRLLPKIEERDRAVLLHMAASMARKGGKPKAKAAQATKKATKAKRTIKKAAKKGTKHTTKAKKAAPASPKEAAA